MAKMHLIILGAFHTVMACYSYHQNFLYSTLFYTDTRDGATSMSRRGELTYFLIGPKFLFILRKFKIMIFLCRWDGKFAPLCKKGFWRESQLQFNAQKVCEVCKCAIR